MCTLFLGAHGEPRYVRKAETQGADGTAAQGSRGRHWETREEPRSCQTLEMFQGIKYLDPGG